MGRPSSPYGPPNDLGVVAVNFSLTAHRLEGHPSDSSLHREPRA